MSSGCVIETFKYQNNYMNITMVMETMQIRMNHGLIKRMDELVKEGIYANRSDVIRDAVRRFVIEKDIRSMVGIIPNTGDSVKEVREIRKKLSKEIKSFDDYKKLMEEVNNL